MIIICINDEIHEQKTLENSAKHSQNNQQMHIEYIHYSHFFDYMLDVPPCNI